MSSKLEKSPAPAAGKLLLRLVSFKLELFPLSPDDFNLLKDRGISVSRIPRDAFSALQSTFLKGVKVEVLPWVEVFPMLLDQFQSSFDPNVFEFRQEGTNILVHVDSIDTAHIKFLDSQVEVLRKFAGRYGFRVRFETKVKKAFVLGRIRFAVDPELIPGFYFGSGETTTSATHFAFHLTASCRVTFSKKLSPVGIPAFKVGFEDLRGDTWFESFSRAFHFAYLKTEECEGAVNFFIHLMSQMPPEKRNK